MTLTEANEYMCQVYLREGWITVREIKKIKRDGLVMAIGILLVAVTPAILLLL